MNRAELTLVVAGALIAAMMLGWILRGMFGRLNSGAPAADGLVAARLAEAEAARGWAEERLVATQEECAQALRERDEARRASDPPEPTHA